MKLFVLILVLSVKICTGQSKYIALVDSAVKQINHGTYFQFDSVLTKFNSNTIKTKRLSFRYKDSKCTILLMVDEQEWDQNDTISLHYFYTNKRLIKVTANIRSGNMTTEQSFYYTKGKLVFPLQYRSVFEVDYFIKQSKVYSTLRKKRKRLS